MTHILSSGKFYPLTIITEDRPTVVGRTFVLYVRISTTIQVSDFLSDVSHRPSTVFTPERNKFQVSTKLFYCCLVCAPVNTDIPLPSVLLNRRSAKFKLPASAANQPCVYQLTAKSGRTWQQHTEYLVAIINRIIGTTEPDPIIKQVEVNTPFGRNGLLRLQIGVQQ